MNKEDIKEILEKNWIRRSEDDAMSRFEYREMQKEVEEHLTNKESEEQLKQSVEEVLYEIRLSLFDIERSDVQKYENIKKQITEYAQQNKGNVRKYKSDGSLCYEEIRGICSSPVNFINLIEKGEVEKAKKYFLEHSKEMINKLCGKEVYPPKTNN